MIPVFNLTRQYKVLEKELDPVVKKVLCAGYFTLGEEVAAFEKEFAGFVGTNYAVGVASGTDALTMVLKACGIGAGDEVILPANAYPSAFGVALAGVRIRLVDVDASGLMDPEKLPGAITTKTRAIIPVHLYGNPADIHKIRKSINNIQCHCEDATQDEAISLGLPRYARNDNLFQENIIKSGKIKHIKNKNKIFIIEDCAQAHGARIGKKSVGQFGDAAIFSFYPSKNLGAYGDGGMIATGSSALDKKLRMLRQYGEKTRYQSEIISGVSRLDELQAAVLRIKLQYLARWNKRRREIAEHYERELEGAGEMTIVNSKVKSQNSKLQFKIQNYSVYHLFVIRTKKRDQLKAYLEKKGIGTGIHYPVPIHLTKSFRDLGYKKGDFPESERQAKEVLSLPMYPELTDSEIETVVSSVKRFFKFKGSA